MTARATYQARSRFAVAAIACLFLGACGSLRYYGQAVHGQADLLARRRPVRSVISDPATAPQLAARLQLALQARQFAVQQLGLPDTRSYTSFVALDRPFVVWNVFATPRYSVDALRHCFPIAGCVGYRGWFSQAAAQADANRLQARGADVWVAGVTAYSTLGWFADPILSSMLDGDEDALSGTIFHELAHQLVYAKQDTAFNESYATFVQTEGLRQWRRARGLPPQNGRVQRWRDGFTGLVLDLRKRLAALYASGVDDAAMAAGKRAEITAFRTRYGHWQQCEHVPAARFAGWLAQPINNARLLPFGLYDGWMPAFAQLYRHSEGSWPAFHASVRALARKPRVARTRALQALMGTVDENVQIACGNSSCIPGANRCP